MKLVIRWKKDAARVPAACVAMLVLLTGGALMRMTVKERLNDERAAATALAANAVSRIVPAIALSSDPGLCGRDSRAIEPVMRALGSAGLAGAGFDYELSCSMPGGGRSRVIARSAARELSNPVLHSSHWTTNVWTIALAPRAGWMPWRLIALQSLLVFVTALFAVLAITTLVRRPEQLRRELRERDRRLKAVHHRLAEAIRQRDTLETQTSAVSRPDPVTSLANRASFIERLALAQQRARLDPAAGVAVIVIHLDRSTAMEDSRWDSAGDELMLQAVRRLEGCLAAREHLIARVADHALALLLVGVTSSESARADAGLLHQALTTAFTIGGQLVFANSHMGVALAAPGNEAAEELLRGAQLALERALDSYRVATAPESAPRPRRAAPAGRHVQVPG